MKYTIYTLLCFLIWISGSRVFAQTEVQGIVFDKTTKQRISRVFVYNAANDEGGYNNTKGEFFVKASPGDVLIAASEGYFPDTLVVSNKSTLVFNLKRSSIRIQEVSIMARRNPDDMLREQQREYSTIYSKGSGGSLLSVGPTGSGLNIDALYSLISREGKNARRLQEIIERDYREAVIDFRFTPELVEHTTGLEGEALKDFMRQYRPSYFFVLGSNDYNLVIYIKSSFAQYKRNPYVERLPPLPKKQ